MSGDIPPNVRTGIALAERYYAAGLNDQAWESVRALAQGAPSHVIQLLASLCYEAGDLGHAQELCAQVPDWADAILLRGRILLDLGRTAEAITVLRRAVIGDPNHAFAHFNLGLAFERMGDVTAAIAAYGTATERQNPYPEAWNNLGLMLERAGEAEAAAAAFQTALRQAPRFHFAAANLAALLIDQGHLDAAIKTVETALTQDSTHAAGWINLGVALLEQGRHTEAERAFAEALAAAPDNADAADNALYLHHYMSNDPAAVMKAHAAWGSRFAAPNARPQLQPEPRLRIGYVSPDFRRHSVSFFFEPLLAHHDRKAVEIFCYASGGRSDAVTQRLQSLADHWRNIASLNDENAAGLIAEDRIDILVDLAGHTKGNRLGIFARRPAPVQVTALGYPGTTGLKEIDYRFCDAVTDPPGAEQNATEKLIRLPSGLHCYLPPADAPAVAELPFLKNGVVTFGSFNKLGKVSDATVALWASVLKAIPSARLYLKSRALTEAETRTITAARFAAHGIASGRLDLVGWVPDDAGHLAAYSRVDIALDTFPYSGTTTTCEALWMGVPVLTLAGATHASRVSASLLTTVNLDAWVTTSSEAFVVHAQSAARDIAALTRLRVDLRARMRGSALCDGAPYAAAVEAAYRKMLAPT
jgi:predicted O-linked N-acetylglucosamine transferase (SPINDLY family)